ncbi:MAG: ABC transporter permease [Anaerolineae bacterium]|nr:ABC transporter permease [Thermoflexales bacterium]MDW8406841.1 ABC transporter permease [Anaerolineae bacterium]
MASVSLKRAPKRVVTFDVFNRRVRTLGMIAFSVAVLAVMMLLAQVLGVDGLQTRLDVRNQPPSWANPFGTDWLGRDMFTRTLQGLTISLRVGLIASALSAVLGLLVGLAAATLGGWVDAAITWLIDLFMSLPHMVALILIAFVFGGGVNGVIASVALTHWTGLARVIRAEVLQLKTADYVQLSARFGHSKMWIARHHLLPHLFPQFVVGLLLLFPHAILHEAGITFIGIGLSPHQPAVGVILSESMRHLSTGYWWLAVLPGLALLVMVKSFDALGENLRALLDPRTAQE